MLKALVVAGDIFYGEGQWDRKSLAELQIPRTVQDAVQRRTARLSPAARQVLNLAAVAGRRFDFALLQALPNIEQVGERGVPGLALLRGKALLALAHLAEAEATLQAAYELVQGSTLREHFMRQALAVLPYPPLTPRQVRKQAYNGLTAREVDVAIQVAQGKSNREVALTLLVSERTVETHVGNILSKLGFSSRHQIAAWVAEKLGLTNSA